MRFESYIHWADGLFLQPHHMQQFQRAVRQTVRLDRMFHLPYPYGLIDFEFDRDSLVNSRLIVKRLSAVMPSGVEVSMPGNAVISPLDLSRVLEEHHEATLIYLALPLYSEFEGNLSEDSSGVLYKKRLYTVRENQVRDENTGDNEVPVIVRQMNACLLTDFDNHADMELLPLMRMIPVSRESQDMTLEVDENYIPPYLVISPDCPLMRAASELLLQIRRCGDKLLNDLTIAGCKPDTLSGINLQNVLQLRSLNSYENRLSALLQPGNLPPFMLYVELRALLGELTALQPRYAQNTVADYKHLDYAPQFRDLFNYIRSLISAEGGVSFVRLDFVPIMNGEYLEVKLATEQMVRLDDYYLAVHCDADDRQIIRAIESGDNFKLVNPSAKSARVRGVKLTEMRYPPRFLPALPNTLWFKLQRGESQRIWREICEEQGVVIDWAHDLFPQLEASLFMTVNDNQRGSL